MLIMINDRFINKKPEIFTNLRLFSYGNETNKKLNQTDYSAM